MDRSYDAFERIDPLKRERIIQAALAEFADKDYPQVSTNAIVKRAGISKGLLFHYFGDKAGLFTYLLEYTYTTYSADLASLVDYVPKGPLDVFDLIERIIRAKLEIARHRQQETGFFVHALKGSLPPELGEAVSHLLAQAYDSMALITAAIDEQLLRPGLDLGKAAKTIYWVMEGLTNETIAGMSTELTDDDYCQMTTDVSEYLGFLRQILYRETDGEREDAS
jgi:AcrR family transcriptional regulator